MRGNLEDDEDMDSFSDWISESPGDSVAFFSDPELDDWEFEIDEDDPESSIRLGELAFEVMMNHLNESKNIGPPLSLN